MYPPNSKILFPSAAAHMARRGSGNCPSRTHFRFVKSSDQISEIFSTPSFLPAAPPKIYNLLPTAAAAKISFLVQEHSGSLLQPVFDCEGLIIHAELSSERIAIRLRYASNEK